MRRRWPEPPPEPQVPPPAPETCKYVKPANGDGKLVQACWLNAGHGPTHRWRTWEARTMQPGDILIEDK